jgi:meiotic recombination protein SPO11
MSTSSKQTYDIRKYHKVRKLYEDGLKRIAEMEGKELQLPEGVAKIDDLTTQEAKERLRAVVDGLVTQIMLTGRPVLKVPNRSSTNIIWDELNDMLLMGEKTTSKSLLSLSSATDMTRLARVMEIVNDLLEQNLHTTKRDLFYTDVNLFKEQKNSDALIEDLATVLHSTRNSTHIIASAMGNCVGRLRIRDGTDILDLSRMGSQGWQVNPALDNIEILETDAEFVLVVEKNAAMVRLAEARFWETFPCIIMAGRGQGDMASRMFLRRLSKMGLPVFLLVDADPYGSYIASVYMRGSKRLSYESPFMATPDLHLLGVLAKDLDEYNIPHEVRIPFTKQDEKRAKELLKEDFIKKNKKWAADLRMMLNSKRKAEIQAFTTKGFKFLVEDYLPTKLETGDWI